MIYHRPIDRDARGIVTEPTHLELRSGALRCHDKLIEAWIDDTGLVGFTLTFAVRPETFVTIVDLLVPELQRRGRYKRQYRDGTLREKLFGHARLNTPHPATRYRQTARSVEGG